MGISKNTFIKSRGLVKSKVAGFAELKPKAGIGGGAQPEIKIGGGVENPELVSLEEGED